MIHPGISQKLPPETEFLQECLLGQFSPWIPLRVPSGIHLGNRLEMPAGIPAEIPSVISTEICQRTPP